MSSSQEVYFLVNVDGESRWTKIGFGKIWIHLFWKSYTDGKYEGELKNGKFHGYGTENYPNGNKYVGEFKNGKHHGSGTVNYHDGVKYEGEWMDG